MVLLGCATLIIAACGSTSSPGAPPTPTPPASSAGAAPSPTPSAASSSGLASPNVAGPAPCGTSSLQVKLGVAQGTAGSIYQVIDFTNTGSTTCTLTGYPGVSLAGGNPLAQIGQPAARNPQPPPAVVTLAPAAVANALLQVTQAGNYPAASCGPVPVSELVVYPPNQTASVSLPYASTGCSSEQLTILHVSTMQSGSGQSGSGG
jgi:hypothetical protein